MRGGIYQNTGTDEANKRRVKYENEIIQIIYHIGMAFDSAWIFSQVLEVAERNRKR